MKENSNVNVDINSLGTCFLNMYFNDLLLSIGTGFFYRRNSKKYLVTALHNLTGKDVETGASLSKQGGRPNRFGMVVRKNQTTHPLMEAKKNLYNGNNEPVWLIHHEYGEKVDVACIEFASTDFSIGFIEDSVDSQGISVKIAQEIFILGYPKGVKSPGILPIWKRASIATEPELDIMDMPKFLVDTATKEGMSGAPVILNIRGGIVETINKERKLVGGQISKFLGVYTGRIGVDKLDDQNLFEAQLGIVWKRRVVDEIIDNGVTGINALAN